jgi:hypothetical protein
MRFDEVRNIIIQEWLDLEPGKRQSEQQASTFATNAIKRHGFALDPDPFNLIMSWLDPYIPMRAGILPAP